MHNNKPYDYKLKNCDIRSKQETKLLLTHMMPHKKLIFRENEEEGKSYSEGLWDLEILFDDDISIKIETEEKSQSFWNDAGFNFPEMDIPDRKRKSQANHFFIFSSSYNIVWMANAKTVFSCKTINKKCKNYKSTEPFIRIPIEKGEFLIKRNDIWRKFI